MRAHQHRIVGFGLAGAALLAGLTVALAAGVTFTPSFIEVRADPGETIVRTIDITNDGDAEQTFEPAMRDIESMDEDGKPIFVAEGTEKSGAELSSWTAFSVPSLRLGAGQKGSVTVTVRVPANAPNGGYFGLVALTRDAPESLGDQSALGIGFTTGPLVSVRVGQGAVDAAVLKEFGSTKGVLGGPEGTFLTRIENTGNALIRPVGVIGIRDMFGREVASTSFNPGAGAILPGVVRKYETQWKGEGLWFGRYTAFLAVSYGDVEKQTLTGSASFWVIPGKLTLSVLGAVVVLFLAVYAWVRTYIRRKLRQAGIAATPAQAKSSPAMFLAVLIAVVSVLVIIVGFAFFFLV